MEPPDSRCGQVATVLHGREVREGLRAMIAHNTDGKPLTEAELRPLEQVTNQAQPRLRVTADGQVRLGATAPARRVADGTGPLIKLG